MDRLKKQLVVTTVVCVGMGMIVAAKSKDGECFQEKLRINGQRLERRIIELSQYGRLPNGGAHRVAYSEADLQGRHYIESLMKNAGISSDTKYNLKF